MSILTLCFTEAPMPAAVQAALAPEYPELFASRDELDPEVWQALAETPKCSADLMSSLAARPLTEAQLLWLFTNERRTAPLLTAIGANGEAVTTEVVSAAAKLPPKVATRLSELIHLPAGTRFELATASGGPAVASVVRDEITLSDVDDRALEVLFDAERWWPTRPSKMVNSVVRDLIEISPGVAAGLCDNIGIVPTELITALAGSHRLSDSAAGALVPRLAELRGDNARFSAMAFVANPAVPIDAAEAVAKTTVDIGSTFSGRRSRRGDRHISGPVDELDDVDLLKWVTLRAVRSDFRPEGRPAYIPDIVRSPVFSNVGDSLVERCQEFLNYEELPKAVVDALLGPDDAPSPEPERKPYVEPTFEPRPLGDIKAASFVYDMAARRTAEWPLIAERLGSDPAAWRNFVTFADKFTGTLGDLCDLVEACG